jgi:hypothetical protein
MLSKYIYKGENITIDIIIKIEQVARLIAKNTNKSFDDCLCDFYNSRAYEALEKTTSLMWSENAEFIVEEYFREKNLYP